MELIIRPLNDFFPKIAEKDIDITFRHRFFLLILQSQTAGD